MADFCLCGAAHTCGAGTYHAGARALLARGFLFVCAWKGPGPRTRTPRASGAMLCSADATLCQRSVHHPQQLAAGVGGAGDGKHARHHGGAGAARRHRLCRVADLHAADRHD